MGMMTWGVSSDILANVSAAEVNIHMVYMALNHTENLTDNLNLVWKAF